MATSESQTPPAYEAAEAAAREAMFYGEPELQSADARAAFADFCAKRIDLATLAGFEQDEIEALYSRALELLRLNLFDAATGLFIALVGLKRREARFLRGLGLCYQSQRDWGWAAEAYLMALNHDAEDIPSMALYAECRLYLAGKQEAHALLTEVVQRGPRTPHDAPYVLRAKEILAKIRL
jgi:lipopolysaccharide biosynthesis regulator YciM